LKNSYRIDENNQLAYIDAFTPHNKECKVITISLDKLEMTCRGHLWTLHKKGNLLYARSIVVDDEGNKKDMYLHRYLTDCPDELVVDHRSGVTLDNHNENLRVCTRQGNNENAKIRKDNKTGCKGVTARKGKFVAAIRVNKKKIHLGTYSNVEAASNAYWEANRKYHNHTDLNALPFI
jgi:hypothetical protein